jgi:hypothetical protein
MIAHRTPLAAPDLMALAVERDPAFGLADLVVARLVGGAPAARHRGVVRRQMRGCDAVPMQVAGQTRRVVRQAEADIVERLDELVT